MGKPKTIIDSLSDLIYTTLQSLSSEQRYPGQDPDRMDDNLKDLESKYKELIRIRAEIEIVCTGVIIK